MVIKLPAFLKWRNKGLFPLFYLLTSFWLLLAPPAGAADHRIEKLSNEKAGPVCISGDWMVFSQNTSNLPAYYNASSGAAGIINPAVRLLNNDPVKIGRGIALYRSSDKKKLWITNLEPQMQWGLAQGASRIVVETDKLVGPYFAICGYNIAYLEGDGLLQNCWVIKESGEMVKIAEGIAAANLQLYQDEEYAFISWRNRHDGILYYCNLNGDLSIKALTGSKADSQYSLWKDRVLYRHQDNGKFYLQNLKPGSKAQKIMLPGASGPLCLRDQEVLYAAGKDIKRCHLADGSQELFVKHENIVLNLDSNGSDLVWQDFLRGGYWRAAVKNLSLSGQKTIKLGESLQLGAQANFKNHYQADVSQTALWTSSNEGIAVVQSGLCTGKSAGSVTIKAVYEEVYADVSFCVKALASLEISPATESLKPGDILQLHAVGVYTDASREDMTTLVIWESSLSGSVSARGLFTAGQAGVAAVKASYGMLSATIHLNIAAADPGQPPSGEGDDEGETNHPGENPDTPNNPTPDPPDPPADQTPVPIHRHSEDETTNITNPPVQNSPILQALKNAPPFSTVEVAIGDADSDSVEFTLESAALEIMNHDQKTLRIKAAIGILDFSPVFAASYPKSDLEFKLSRRPVEAVPQYYGNCQLNPVSASCLLSVKNEAGSAIDSFAAPIVITLYSNTGKLAQNKSGVLGNGNNGREWKYLKSIAAGVDARKFACGFPGIFGLMEFNCQFADINGHWAQPDIEILAAQQLIEDTDERSFAPDRVISRGEFAALLARGADFNIMAANHNQDSVANDNDRNGQAYLTAAVQAGIIIGDLQNDLALQRGISREEMAVMMSRVLSTRNIPVEAYSGTGTFIGDWEAISPWARNEVEVLNNLGIMQGHPDSSFAPRQAGTRAEAAAVVRRLLDYLRRQG